MRQSDQQTGQPIDDVLEACRLRLGRGQTIAACLAAFPDHASELAALLPLAARIQALAHDPDPRHAAAARRRFQLTLAAARENRSQAEAARSRRPMTWLTRLAVPLALVLILSASGIGLVQASDGSLPDSPLYTVKQAGENVGMLFARSPEGKAMQNARVANRRRLDLQYAEQVHKGPMLRLGIARAMVEASNRATDQTILMSEPARAEAAKNLTRQL
ncbi:MAG TPA: DUF5667 domain-containing protein, partial [Chloroflexota bacterium]|nr:DUF5667 domain-containing protein [Chloroflexota bacterium]